MTQRFDWGALMRAGIGGLRLPPDQFWALTPAELQLMLGQGRPAPLGRKGLSTLMAAYPDEGEDNDRAGNAGRADRPAGKFAGPGGHDGGGV